MPAAARSVFTIPSGASFVDALAAGILERADGEPLELARHLILLPTRRACRSLREAFLRVSGGRPLLLPRMRPLGDLDEDELALAEDGLGGPALDLPPAVPPLRRQLLLARLVLAMGGERGGGPPSPEQAAQLAAELGRLLDQVQTEGLDFQRLAGLVPDAYAAHWQVTLDFLRLVTEHWPKVLAEQGYMDAAERRRLLLEAQAKSWRRAPPAHPVVAAGSTGSIPATAELLATVAGLPGGILVLPGLDRAMDDESWAALDVTHPQYGMKRLLERLELAPAAVAEWPCGGAVRRHRERLIAEVMRPAATTEAWRAGGDGDAAALAGVRRLDCPGGREEAGAIALVLRGVLEEAGRTAALVTPDRTLARRVAAELRRWGVGIDDSAGRPLALTVPGTFLRLAAEMVAQDFAPHAVLAALKHPLAAGGTAAPLFRSRVRRLERQALRGPRPGGIDGIIGRLKDEDLRHWLAGVAAMARPLAEAMARDQAPLADLVRAHLAFAEALAGDDREVGARRLWRGEAGEQAALFVADLAEAAAALPALAGRRYPALLDVLMRGRVVRPAWGGHPRIHIWGPLEARLQHADVMVLGGLTEGSWPPQAEVDPWMSRPMRRDFGLPPPERRIGLSAHDFAQAFCAPEVVLTRAARLDGTPTVPSRWLLRLDTVLRAQGLAGRLTGGPWAEWFLALDRPARIRPTPPPAPRPPVEQRPRKLYATEIETWMRDPYAIYARRILRLEALDSIDADPGAADYGSVVHKALERFQKAYPDAMPDAAEARLLEIGRAVFTEKLRDLPGVWAFWWPRFESVARWFAGIEAGRRAALAASYCEFEGALTLDGPAGPFVVAAKADRIDLLADGTLAVIDYKTGAPPSRREVAAGFAPQLPVEAAIARAGGFPGIPARAVSELLYWRLKGGETGGEISGAGDDPGGLADAAVEGLRGLILAFDRVETPYEARPHPERAPRFSDYAHLARVKEWATAAGEEDA